jgi:hypothetical protein
MLAALADENHSIAAPRPLARGALLFVTDVAAGFFWFLATAGDRIASQCAIR